VNFDSLKKFLRAIHQRLQADTTGAVASYLPELASADPNWFGISAVSVHGETCNLGQCTQPFTIQSIAKPFVYGLVLEELGEQQVLQHIGVEPTGDAFNSLIEPDEISPTHYNPLVNSGAIVTSSLVPGGTIQERSRRLLSPCLKPILADRLTVDSAAFHSKKTTDHLNRALAHMMLHYGWINGDVDSILDLYFQQCSVLATCEDLAMMAAALANGGCNPGSGAQALQPRYVKNVLSIMSTCGLYEFSGQWAFTVGIPAKSGLAGAIIGVIPQQLGIAVFSPPLDENRKSHRAVEVFKQLSQQFKLHQFDHAAISPRSIDFQRSQDQPRRIYNSPCRMCITSTFPAELDASTAVIPI
jgi:glutaminase